MKSPLQVAVFPLPKIVAFPGHALQFHIFEPRYRRMVRDCVETGQWVGVAQGDLTKKARLGQSMEEFLNSNQESYAPVSVFGAGPLKVLKCLPDGRFVIEVHIEQRMRAVATTQELPYRLVLAEPLFDLSSTPAEEALAIAEIKAEVGRLAALRVGLLKQLQSKQYLDDSNLNSLVYSILKWFVIENREGQALLEDNSPLGRAEKLLASMRLFVRRDSSDSSVSPSRSAPRQSAGPRSSLPSGSECRPPHESPGKGFSGEDSGEAARVLHVNFEKKGSRPEADER